jgi:hypothetical protein
MISSGLWFTCTEESHAQRATNGEHCELFEVLITVQHSINRWGIGL